VLTTKADTVLLMRSTDELECRLQELAAHASNALGAEAVIVGGGPLGRLARGLGRKLNAPIIEPIPEAVRQVARVLGVNLRR
jgi:Asp/Glu/hydantoin racemase